VKDGGQQGTEVIQYRGAHHAEDCEGFEVDLKTRSKNLEGKRFPPRPARPAQAPQQCLRCLWVKRVTGKPVHSG
jgi:hypothetical protein